MIGAGIAGVLYWLHVRQYESTDDAGIEARVIPISPKVAGHVADLLVNDNQQVAEGQVLLRIDPRDFQVRLAQARAALAAAQAKQQAAKTNIVVSSITTSADIQ